MSVPLARTRALRQRSYGQFLHCVSRRAAARNVPCGGNDVAPLPTDSDSRAGFCGTLGVPSVAPPTVRRSSARVAATHASARSIAEVDSVFVEELALETALV